MSSMGLPANGKARSKNRVFKGLNSSCQGGQIFWCHAVNASTFWVLSRSASFHQRHWPKVVAHVANWLVNFYPRSWQ